MKKLVLLLIVLFVSFNLFAQKGISFQGIARDAAGNAITGENISVTFTIGDFSEQQDLTTDAFGVFSATIGSVTPTTDFDNLVFANIDENLKVDVDGVTIYNDKFNTVPYAKAAENGVPPGSIMPFAGAANNVPAGWLLCNGDSKAKTGMYSKLFVAIGTAWGDDGGNFKIPDLRGVFLRGINNGRTDGYADPDTRDVGEFQGDEFKEHYHDASSESDGNHRHGIKGDSANGLTKSDNCGDANSDRVLNNFDGQNDCLTPIEKTEYGGSHTHPINVDLSGGDETRPVNAGVNFIIKY